MPCRTMVATAGLARPPTMTKTTKKAKRALVAAAKVVVRKMVGGAGQYWMWSKWTTMRACAVGAGKVTGHLQREMRSKQRGNGCEQKTDLPPSAVGPAAPLTCTMPTPPDPR